MIQGNARETYDFLSATQEKHNSIYVVNTKETSRGLEKQSRVSMEANQTFQWLENIK